MKIVIIGLGTIGRTILKSLSAEGHTITIIDEDKNKIETLIEKYDVSGVVGNGACLDIQKEAGVRSADIAIALTNSDELNVFVCLVAKKLGVTDVITHVGYLPEVAASTEYIQLVTTLKDVANYAKNNGQYFCRQKRQQVDGEGL